MKKIAIVNAHWNNRGDEAALRAIIDSILSHLSEAYITIVFKDNGEIKQYPYSNQVKYITTKFLPTPREVFFALLLKGRFIHNADMKKIVQVINDSDVVIYAPGGAVISDRFWWKKQLEYLFPIAYAERRKIPTFFAAPSVGPFSVRRRFRDRVLKKVNKICVREGLSYLSIKRYVGAKNVEVTVDSAFLNDIDIAANKSFFYQDERLKDFFGKFNCIVGITITDFGWHVEYGKDDNIKIHIKDTFCKFIQWLNQKGVGVLFIPQLFGNQDDKEYLQEFEMENTFLLSDERDTFFQQYIISKLYMVIGMRYHSNIFAAKMRVPFIPVVYEEKMAGFLRDFDLEDLGVALEKLSVSNLQERYEWVEKNRNHLLELLDEKCKECKRKAQTTEKEMLEILKD